MRIKSLGLALLGAFTLAISAQAGVISVNFLSDEADTSVTNAPYQFLASGTTAGIYPRGNWNNVYNSPSNTTSGTVGSLTNDAGTATAAEVTWGSAETWYDGNAVGDATNTVGDAQMAYGYLDDGGAGVTIDVTGIPYANYYAVIYFSTDDLNVGVYTPADVNGDSYTTTGNYYNYFNPNWMDYNTIVATNLSGDLSIAVGPKNLSDRGAVAGIQIVESTEGAPPAEPALAPEWTSDPVNGGSVVAGDAYTGSLAGEAVDRNGDSIEYSLAEAFTWLNVATNGVLDGPVAPGTAGTNVFLVAATGGGIASTGTLQIVVLDPPSTGDSTAISVNLREANANQQIASSTTAGLSGYVYANWNDAVGASGTLGSLVDSDANTTAAEVTWSAGGVWGDASANVDANAGVGDAQMMRGYLDDNNSSNTVSITVANVPYAQYDVVVYYATDAEGGDGYGETTVDTVAMTADGARQNYGSNPIWGGGNSIVVTGLTAANLTITAVKDTPSGNRRASVCGIQLINVAYVPGGQVTDLVISTPTGGTEIVLTWTGEDLKLYGVETNSNLIVGDWQNFQTGLVGDGGTMTVTNAIGPDQTFYQVISE